MLEYCSSIWNPYLLHDIDRLEKVQRAYTKRLTRLRDKSYNERLEVCQLISFESRRLHTDLILCYKIVKSQIDLKFDDFFVFENYTRTRGHNFKLRAPRCHKQTVAEISFQLELFLSGTLFPSHWLIVRHLSNSRKA